MLSSMSIHDHACPSMIMHVHPWSCMIMHVTSCMIYQCSSMNYPWNMDVISLILPCYIHVILLVNTECTGDCTELLAFYISILSDIDDVHFAWHRRQFAFSEISINRFTMNAYAKQSNSNNEKWRKWMKIAIINRKNANTKYEKTDRYKKPKFILCACLMMHGMKSSINETWKWTRIYCRLRRALQCHLVV